MKILITTLTAFATSGLFANQISENLAYSSPIYPSSMEERVDAQKNINHITFKVGPGIIKDNNGHIIPIFGIGYQSKISESVLFQSSSIEFGGTYKESRGKKDGVHTKRCEGLFYFPKVMGLHYFNKDSENRIFLGVGSNISTYHIDNDTYNYSDPEYVDTSNYSNTTSIGLSASTGVEMGKSSASINTLQIEVDQPIMDLYYNGESNLSTRVFATYTVGF